MSSVQHPAFFAARGLNSAERTVPNPSSMPAPLLAVENLRTYFYAETGVARSVDGVSFEVMPGETVGLVGESGCGKSVTSLSIMRLVRPPGRLEPGSRILFDGTDLLTLEEERMRA